MSTEHCTVCGVAFEVSAPEVDPETGRRRGGRPPKRCEAHRKQNRVRGDRGAQNARLQAQRRNERAGEWAKKASAPTHDLQCLALALSLEPDPRRAAEAAGLSVPAEQAEAMAAEAKRRFPGLADAGDMASIRNQVRVTYGRYALELGRRISDMPPGLLPNALRALDTAYASLAASDGAPRYAVIEMFVTSPDGQKAKVE